MRLGDHTIAVRRLVATGGTDQYGNPAQAAQDTRIHGCLVVPASRSRDTDEPRDRSAPRIVGLELYAPAGADLLASDVVIWPVRSFVPADPQTPDVGTATGPTYQVDGDVGPWEESTEARLIKTA